MHITITIQVITEYFTSSSEILSQEPDKHILEDNDNTIMMNGTVINGIMSQIIPHGMRSALCGNDETCRKLVGCLKLVIIIK